MPSDYSRIEAAIRFLHENQPAQPSLEEVARGAGVSAFHFQRLFRQWAGVSPKRFLQCLTVEHAKRLLLDSRSVLDAALDVGLSSPGRLHDHFVSVEAVTPGEFKSRGEGLVIRYGTHESPFGRALIAVTERGICGLAFADGGAAADELDALREHWRGARFVRDGAATASLAEAIFEPGARNPRGARKRSAARWPLLVMGTNFQVQVWRALLRIPEGSVCSYGQLARVATADAPGAPARTASAARAIGGAVGANRIAYLIPCHRVIRSVGAIGGYRWGETRKVALLAWESARAGTPPSEANRSSRAASGRAG